jgi:uncharacterized membrane protein YqgA involved in biofilm formation
MGGLIVLGTIINAAAIIVAALLGVMLRKGIPDKMSRTIMDGFGLLLVVLGVQMGLKYENVVVVIVSLVLGTILGEWLDIDRALERLGVRIEKRISSDGSRFGEAFVASTLLYCTGAMAIMGALENGLTGRYDILLVKSWLDGISSLVFAASMGIGVAFSAIPLFLYQGSISLLAVTVKPFLTTAIMNNLTSLGGMLILGIGLNILNLTKIKIANLLPGLFLIPLVMAIIKLIV